MKDPKSERILIDVPNSQTISSVSASARMAEPGLCTSMDSDGQKVFGTDTDTELFGTQLVSSELGMDQYLLIAFLGG